MFKRLSALTLALLLTALLTLPAAAAPAGGSYCFSSADFLPENSEALRGVFVTEVPGWECIITCGGRRIRAGDALTAAQLTQLTITPRVETDTTVPLSYLPVYDDAAGAPQTLWLALRGSRNQPPAAVDSEAETYKNLELRGTLNCSDPEGEALTVTLKKAPRRGEVTFGDGGSFVYTPKKNKVGTDTFTYVVTDAAGNSSEEATVTIHIRNPKVKGTFADMQGDPQEFEARFLRESGAFSGEMIGGTLCFCPEKPVTGQEFLMMLMHLTGLQADEAAAAEENWFAPWQQSALRAGLPCPDADTGAGFGKDDAAVLVANVLDLSGESAVRVFSDPQASAAAVSMTALEAAGLPCFAGSDMDVLTRREAAVLLCAVNRYCQTHELTFPWN